MESLVAHSISSAGAATAKPNPGWRSQAMAAGRPRPGRAAITESSAKSTISIALSGLMRRDPIHILRAASFTEFRGDRCVRHYRQVTIRPMLKNS
jgi:hypothetical protein